MVLTESNYKLKKGDSSPNFSLTGTDGKIHSLHDIKNLKAILVVFICNHCPYVLAKLHELNRIANDFRNDLKVIGINSNDSDAYPDDSFENMKKFVAKGKVAFEYFFDETQEVAKSFGAVCTPDPFLLDNNFNLIFHSRIDDPPGMNEAKRHELYDAIKEFLENGKISLPESPSTGCSIKWK